MFPEKHIFYFNDDKQNKYYIDVISMLKNYYKSAVNSTTVNAHLNTILDTLEEIEQGRWISRLESQLSSQFNSNEMEH